MSSIIQEAIVKHSQGTASAWTSADTVLESGEWGYETDTGKAKIGDGSTAWTSLAYAAIPNPGTVSTFDTGWVSNSDWTNVDLTVTHNLSSNLSDLIVKLFISTDGTEANAFEIINSTKDSATMKGYTTYQDSINTFHIQTGEAGIAYCSDTDGTVLNLDTESWYYKVKVYKLS